MLAVAVTIIEVALIVTLVTSDGVELAVTVTDLDDGMSILRAIVPTVLAHGILDRLGPEIDILERLPLEDVARAADGLFVVLSGAASVDVLRSNLRGDDFAARLGGGHPGAGRPGQTAPSLNIRSSLA